MGANVYCPVPYIWHEIHQAHVAARDRSGDPGVPMPPTPLILAGWAYSSDGEKFLRWGQTVQWAERYGLAKLIPELSEDEVYGRRDQ